VNVAVVRPTRPSDPVVIPTDPSQHLVGIDALLFVAPLGGVEVSSVGVDDS
jgi:hypothetical protein